MSWFHEVYTERNKNIKISLFYEVHINCGLWRRHISNLVCIWCLFYVYLMSTWCLFDVYLMSIWCLFFTIWLSIFWGHIVFRNIEPECYLSPRLFYQLDTRIQDTEPWAGNLLPQIQVQHHEYTEDLDQDQDQGQAGCQNRALIIMIEQRVEH